MNIKKLAGTLIILAVVGLVVFSANEGFRKFGDYARSGRTLGELSRLRGYSTDFKARHGVYAPDLSAAVPKALDLREHASSAEVGPVSLSSAVIAEVFLTTPPEDTGKWAYDSATGFVFISCTHENHSRGRPWWRY